MVSELRWWTKSCRDSRKKRQEQIHFGDDNKKSKGKTTAKDARLNDRYPTLPLRVEGGAPGVLVISRR